MIKATRTLAGAILLGIDAFNFEERKVTMKICISAYSADLKAQVDPRFGRAPYFIIIETDSMAWEAIPNSAVDSAHGAGIQSAELMHEKGVEAVITGHVGPNAFQALKAAGIKIYQSDGAISVEQAIEALKSGRLSQIQESGPSHAGMGRGHGRG